MPNKTFVPALLFLTIQGSLAAAEPSVRTRFGSADDPHRPESLRAVAVSPDGRLAALAGEPETPTNDLAVQIRDCRTGDLVQTLAGHEASVRSVAFSPQGDVVATVTSDADGVGVVRLFDAESGKRIRVIDAGGRQVRFLPDGRLVVAGFGRVLLFDPATGREVGRFLAMPVVKDVSSDGRFAVGVSHLGQSMLEVRDLGAQKAVARLVGSTVEPLAASFSPDGRTVAASDPRTRSVLVWEVLTGQVVHRLDANTAIASFAFTPDERHLLGGGLDASIRCWEVATGGETGRLSSHEGAVMALAAGRGETLLSGSTDRTAVLWSLGDVRGTALPTAPLAESDFDAAWESLTGPAGPAYRSLGLLAARPGDVLPAVIGRVERQLVPVPDADLARLLAELDHGDYLVRERATEALAKAGDSIRPHLERALLETTSLETRSRLRILLRRSGLTPRFSPGDLLRLRRLIGHSGSLPGDDAKHLLHLIADEFPDPAVAGEAREALRGME